MRIAVTYENGEIFQHFGHTESFKLYIIEDGVITATQIVDTNGTGHGALADMLASVGVSTLICGGIGGGARNALAEVGIEIYPGAMGNADANVESFLAGNLNYDPDTMCNHHGEGHTCGGHEGGCGGHHHHGHHADEVFVSYGAETTKKFNESDLKSALESFTNSDRYGMILRAKGIVECECGSFIHFDYVPGESQFRAGSPDYTGRICIIGAHIDEKALKELWNA